MSTNSGDDGSDFLEPMRKKVTVGDEEIEVRPLKVGQFKSAAKHLRPLLTLFQDLPRGGKAQVIPVDKVLEFLENCSDEAVELVATLVKKDVAFLNELDLLDFARILAAVVQVNRDFFMRVLPAFLKKENLLPGLKLSSASLPQDMNMMPS